MPKAFLEAAAMRPTTTTTTIAYDTMDLDGPAEPRGGGGEDEEEEVIPRASLFPSPLRTGESHSGGGGDWRSKNASSARSPPRSSSSASLGHMLALFNEGKLPPINLPTHSPAPLDLYKKRRGLFSVLGGGGGGAAGVSSQEEEVKLMRLRLMVMGQRVVALERETLGKDAWFPKELLRLPRLCQDVVQAALHFLLGYAYATRFEYEETRSGETAAYQPSLIMALDSLLDYLQDRGLFELLGVTDDGTLLECVASVIFFVLLPHALEQGKTFMVRACLAWMSDTFALLLESDDIEPEEKQHVLQTSRALFPDFHHTALDMATVLRARRCAYGVRRTCLARLAWIQDQASHNSSAEAAAAAATHSKPFDPFQTVDMMLAYVASPLRAPLVWPTFRGSKEAGSTPLPDDTSFHLVAFTARDASKTRMAMASLRALSGGGGGGAGGSSRSEEMLARSQLTFKTPTRLMHDSKVQQYLPACWLLLMERGKRAGELHNEDRWWMTQFVYDTLGGTEGGVDIEDLVESTQRLCRKNFGIKQAAHIRAHATQHAEKVEEQRLGGKPLVVLPSCNAMGKSAFAYTSDRRASACPFVPQNADSVGGEAVRRLIEAQLRATPEGQQYLEAHPDCLEDIVRAANHGEQDAGCLGHYNLLVRVRHGEASLPRTSHIYYPSHFAQLQALRDRPSS
jgi:hypothetical protein